MRIKAYEIPRAFSRHSSGVAPLVRAATHDLSDPPASAAAESVAEITKNPLVGMRPSEAG